LLEQVLRGAIQIHPRAEGGRNVVILTGPETLARVPMDAETAADIGRVLALSDEDFAAEMAHREAASRLTVVENGRTPE
jgi:hypothetical protein